MAHQRPLFHGMQPRTNPHPDHRSSHLQANGFLYQGLPRGSGKLGGHKEANPTADRPPLTRPSFPRSTPSSFCSSIPTRVSFALPPRPSRTTIPRPPQTSKHPLSTTTQPSSLQSPPKPNSHPTSLQNKGHDHTSKILGKSISLPIATPDSTVQNRGKYHRTS